MVASTMEVHLEPEQQCDPNVEFPAQMLSNALRATLHWPASPTAKSRKLAIDILYFATATEHNQPEFEEVWPHVLYAVARIPAGSEWHDHLVEAIEMLRNTDSAVYTGQCFPEDVLAKLENVNMQDLPDWPITLTEYWNGINNPDSSEAIEAQDLDQWRNVNSFLARLGGRGYLPALARSTYELRAALEKPPRNDSYDDPLSACRVWIACEYLHRAGDRLYEKIMDPVDKYALSSSKTSWGSLCKDIVQGSAQQRWEFWKEQLKLIEGQTTLNKDKLRDAVAVMDRVEGPKSSEWEARW